MAQLKRKNLLGSIQKGNHQKSLKKVPEDEIHYVASFSSPADVIEYEKENEKYGDLFIGPKSATHSANHDFLKSCNIKCILSLSTTPIEEKMKLPAKEMDYYYFAAKDEVDYEISKLFKEIHAIMDENILNGKNVLVHCNQGVSRSGSIAISYLMKTLNLSYKDARTLARKSRSAIRPNDGFIKQLEQFEKECLKNVKKEDVDDNKQN